MCAGTVEDRVAQLLTKKCALGDAVVGAGERWITRLVVAFQNGGDEFDPLNGAL